MKSQMLNGKHKLNVVQKYLILIWHVLYKNCGCELQTRFNSQLSSSSAMRNSNRALLAFYIPSMSITKCTSTNQYLNLKRLNGDLHTTVHTISRLLVFPPTRSSTSAHHYVYLFLNLIYSINIFQKTKFTTCPCVNNPNHRHIIPRNKLFILIGVQLLSYIKCTP